ncbi:MAG: hypothetical protein IJ074_06095 [Clostridia bacterium]|nr:hypothetical protein [Clostridia bacterium]
MYTEQDDRHIAGELRRYGIITGVLVVALLTVYILSLKYRWSAAAMVTACALFIAVAFMVLEYLWPCARYKRFLKDMREGLHRELEGTIVEIADQEDLQDGVRVLPVRIFLEDEQDERIVYLNADKRAQFPQAGAKVRVNCFGRHIREVL